MFPAGEPEPRCPVAVVRVDDDGTEQAFTRELRWEPLSAQLKTTSWRDAWEVGQDWAEVFMIDMIVAMRRVRYGDSDPSVRVYYDDYHGVWGQRRTEPDIDLADGEAVLVKRTPSLFRWYVSDEGKRREIVRVAHDGTEHRFTDELSWQRSGLLGSARGLEEVPEGTAMWRVAGVVERVREAWSHRWPGPYHFAIFNEGRHVFDLASALHVVRAKGGHDAHLGDSFGILSDWLPTTTLRSFAMADHRGVKISIAPSEVQYLVEVIRGRREQWLRAYGN